MLNGNHNGVQINSGGSVGVDCQGHSPINASQ
jgi:hypothetical protein